MGVISISFMEKIPCQNYWSYKMAGATQILELIATFKLPLMESNLSINPVDIFSKPYQFFPIINTDNLESISITTGNF